MIFLPSFQRRARFRLCRSEALESLDDHRRASYTKLQQAAENLKAADNAVAESISNIKAANNAVVEHEKFIAAMPTITFHDVWRVDK